MACFKVPECSEQEINVIHTINEISLNAPTLPSELLETIDDRVNSLLIPGNFINLNYNDNSNSLTVSVTGVQPSGNYSLVGHTHTISNITDLNNLSITYPQLSDASGVSLNAARRVASAWVNFNGAGTVFIRSSFNISSIVDNGIGDYTINFINPFTNTNYSFIAWSRDWNSDNYVVNGLGAKSNSLKTISSIRLINNYVSNAINYDSPECNVVFFGK